jgi:hypothetical protein
MNKTPQLPQPLSTGNALVLLARTSPPGGTTRPGARTARVHQSSRCHSSRPSREAQAAGLQLRHGSNVRRRILDRRILALAGISMLHRSTSLVLSKSEEPAHTSVDLVASALESQAQLAFPMQPIPRQARYRSLVMRQPPFIHPSFSHRSICSSWSPSWSTSLYIY